MKMLCRVCDQNDASKWNFYGADNVCPSCRGFFLRSVQSNTYKKFHEKQCNSECLLTQPKSPKRCKKCRFEKCLAVGMKVSYVKSFEQINLQKKIGKPLELVFSEENQMEVLNCWDKIWLSSICDFSFKMYAKNEKHLIRHFTLTIWGTNENQEIEDFDKYINVQRMQSYALNYFKVEHQSCSDAFKLLKHNFDRMMTFNEAVCFCNVRK